MRQPVFPGCVEAVDADGFRTVGRPVPRGAHILDFIARAAAPTTKSSHAAAGKNRFRPLQVSDLCTNATHTTTQEEESADLSVDCGVCEEDEEVGTAVLQTCCLHSFEDADVIGKVVGKYGLTVLRVMLRV